MTQIDWTIMGVIIGAVAAIATIVGVTYTIWKDRGKREVIRDKIDIERNVTQLKCRDKKEESDKMMATSPAKIKNKRAPIFGSSSNVFDKDGKKFAECSSCGLINFIGKEIDENMNYVCKNCSHSFHLYKRQVKS